MKTLNAFELIVCAFLFLFSSSSFSYDIEKYQQQLNSTETKPFDKAVARHQLGFAYMVQEEYQKAFDMFEANQTFHESRNDLPSLANYYLYAGQAAVAMDKWEEAEKQFKRAFRIWPNTDMKRMLEVVQLLLKTQNQQNKLSDVLRTLEQAESKLTKEQWKKHLADKVGIYQYKYVEQLIGTGFVVVCLMLLVGLFFHKTRKISQNSGLMMVSLVIALVLADWIAGFFVSYQGVRHFLHEPNKTHHFKPVKDVMPGIDYEQSTFSSNSIGLRGDELSSDSAEKYLFIGGSSTEVLYLDDKDAWSYLVQEQLSAKQKRHVWVGNAGKSGLNSFSHRSQVNAYIDSIKPTALVIQAGINDLNLCVSGGLSAITDNARKGKKPGYEESYEQYVFHKVLPEVQSLRWFPHLSQYAIGLLQQQSQMINAGYVVQDVSGFFYQGQRDKRLNAQIIDDLPDISVCVSAYAENLRKIYQMSSEAGVRLHLLTQGSLYRADLSEYEDSLLWFGSVGVNPFSTVPATKYYSAKAMQKLLDQYNQETLKVCSELSIECLDVDQHLAKNVDHYYDDVHLNIKGSRELGKIVSSWLMGMH